MNESILSGCFQFSEEPQSADPRKQIILLQFEYDRIKKKYERLKRKYQDKSNQQEMFEKAQIVQNASSNIFAVNKQNIETQNPIKQNLTPNLNSVKQNLSEEFSWSSQHNKEFPNPGPSSLLLSKKQTNIQVNDASQTSDNFAFDESNLNNLKMQNPSREQSFNIKSHNKIQIQKLEKCSSSKNSNNFSFSNTFNLTVFTDKINVIIPSINNSDNFEISLLKDHSNSFQNNQESYQNQESNSSIPRVNESEKMFYDQSAQLKDQNSDNISFSVNKSSNYKHQDLADSNDFKLNQSQILAKSQQKNNQVLKQAKGKLKSGSQLIKPLKKPQVQQKAQHESSSMKSYDDSKLANNQAFKYQLKEFSFRLPEQINDPIEINYSTIEPNTFESTFRNSIQKSIINNKKTDTIQQNFQYHQFSEDEQTQFYRKLISKLSIKRKINIKQIKKISHQMQKHSEKYPFLKEIFQTGTLELNLTQTNVLKDQFLQQFQTWNKTLITQLTLDSEWPYGEINSFFKQFQFPQLKSLTFRLREQIVTSDFRYFKVPNTIIDLNFLRYFGLSKKLKSLTLKGETMTESIATSIVDLDFPLLKTLYIGFQTPFTNQVVDILVCNKLRNLPKSKIYIATWEGTADDRFEEFYSKIDFQFLQTDSEDL